MTPNLTAIDPGDKVLHIPGNDIRGIRDDLGSHSHMSLLHQLACRLHRLRHSQPRHNYRQAPTADCRNGDFILHVAHLRLLGEDPHGVQLLEEERLVALAERVGGGEEREAVRKVSNGPAELVVFVVRLDRRNVVAAHYVV